MAEHTHDPLDPAHLFGHVKDDEYFELPQFLGGKYHIPQPFGDTKPLIEANPTLHMEAVTLRLTKFMVLEVVIAVIIAAVFITIARRISSGDRPRGRMQNFFEAMLVFMRDEVARPAIGKHDGDHFLPFLWTVFFFILGCNLMGMLPWAGSPTGALAVTAAMALVTFGTVVGTGMMKMGPLHFWTGLVPHMDLPMVLLVFLWPLLFVLEFIGLLIKHFVLAVRLLANVMAGHLVLAVIVAFIAATASSPVWYGVMPASVIGATLLSLLELFVAFLQAYIFTFLSALFIGAAVHPH